MGPLGRTAGLPSERRNSASWMMLPLWFAVMLSRYAAYAVAFVGTSNTLVWNRWSKLCPVLLSMVVHVAPLSLEPWTCQSRGSRSGESFALVRAYRLAVTPCAKLTRSHPVEAKASHLLFSSPSTALAAVSFGAFSALAVTPVLVAVKSPGMPVGAGPVTPELLVPSGVLTQVGGDWFASKELANATSPGAAAAVGG